MSLKYMILGGYAKIPSLRLTLRSEGHRVGVSVICPGFVEEEGMYETNSKASGGTAPFTIGTVSMNRVERAVVCAIRRNEAEILLAGKPMLHLPLSDALQRYAAAFPNVPIWITEMGVADDNPIGPQHYPTIAEYMRDLYKYVDERYTRQVPVLIWFAWSDLMRNAGIIDSHGNPKAHVYDAFRAMRNREL
jgi:hypothetical protein